MELLTATTHGRVLLDGAHNPAGARALAAALAELHLSRFPLVFGAMRGKRVTAVLRALAPLRPEPIFTRVADAGARSPESLLAAWRRVATGGAAGRTAPGPGEALRQAAASRLDDEQPIVVAGSLYLVGAVRAGLLGEEATA
jgi:dihydrofolate synthase/folylpolyglutamate synthase